MTRRGYLGGALAMTVGAIVAGCASPTSTSSIGAQTDPGVSRTGGARLAVQGGIELTAQRLAELAAEAGATAPVLDEVEHGELDPNHRPLPDRGRPPRDHGDGVSQAPPGGPPGRSFEMAHAGDGVGLAVLGAPIPTPVEDARAEHVTAEAARSEQTPKASVWWRANLNGGGGFPADAQIAASTTHIVVTSRQTMGFYTKSGQKLQQLSSKSFFSPLGLSDGTADQIAYYNDLRTIYDEYRGRFWVVVTAGRDKKTASKERPLIVAAISKSNDPTSGWYQYYWEGVSQYGKNDSTVWKPGDQHDYPIIGADPFGIHQTNAVSHAAGGGYWRVVFFPGAPFAQGAPGNTINGWQFWDLKNPDGTGIGLIQPAVHHGKLGRAYYTSRFSDDRVLIWGLTNPLTPNQTMQRVEVPVASGSEWNNPVNAPQSGSTQTIKMTNLGTSPVKAVYRGGYLHLVTNDARDWFGDGKQLTSVRLMRVFVLGFPNVNPSPQQGFINRVFGKNSGTDDQPADRVHYGWPAVEVNSAKTMVVVYARTGSKIFPEVRFSAYYDNEGDIRPSRLLKAGEASYELGYDSYDSSDAVLPWGDTAGACVDPADENAVWIAQQFTTKDAPTNNGNYDIAVGRVFGTP